MKELFIKGYVVLVDGEDYESLVSHNWKVRNDQKQTYFYRGTNILERKLGYGYSVFLHREVTNTILDKGICIDHINRNSLDNRKLNLRKCTIGENTRNRLSYNKSSIYKGVYPNTAKTKFRATIYHGRKYDLGVFNTEVEAAIAYNKEAIKLHKEFAGLNLIPENMASQFSGIEI